MDLEAKSDGRQHFILGPVEKWVVGIIALAFVSAGAWQVRATQTLIIQGAVINEQLRVLSLQSADYPAQRAQTAELKIRVERLEQDAREQRQTKALK